MSKYLTSQQLLPLIDDSKFETIEFSTNDTINEEAILDKLLKFNKREELFSAVMQMAIVGFGGKQYNQYKYKGEAKELKTIFSKLGVKRDNSLNDRLSEDDITPRRLLRIYRSHIKSYLELNPQVSSYLYVKYSKKSENLRINTFPGSEHIVDSREIAAELYQTYLNLDKHLKDSGKDSGISDRVYRVLVARNMIN